MRFFKQSDEAAWSAWAAETDVLTSFELVFKAVTEYAGDGEEIILSFTGPTLSDDDLTAIALGLRDELPEKLTGRDVTVHRGEVADGQSTTFVTLHRSPPALTKSVFAPDSQVAWGLWSIGVPVLARHEMRFQASSIDAAGNILLIFEGPYRDDRTLIDISTRLGQHLPAVLGERYIMIDRMDGETPRISIGLMIKNDMQADAVDFWRRWLADSTVLAEIRAVADSMSCDTEAGKVTIGLRSPTPNPSEDLRSQLPRLQAHLTGDYAGGTITCEPGRRDDQVILTITKPAATATEDEVFDAAAADEGFTAGTATTHVPVPIGSSDGTTTCAACGGLVVIEPSGNIVHGDDPKTRAAIARAEQRLHDLTPDYPDPEPDVPAAKPAAVARRRWQVLLHDALIAFWRMRHGDQPLPAGYPGAVQETLALALLGTGLILLAGIIAAGIVGVGIAIGRGLAGLAGFVHDSAGARIVIGPAVAWINGYGTGMPVPASSLVWVWAMTGLVTFTLGWLSRNIGARIGWCLWGAGTAYIVWHGTSIGSQQMTVGVLGVWWVLLSLLVFRRRPVPTGVNVRQAVADGFRTLSKSTAGLLAYQPDPETDYEDYEDTKPPHFARYEQLMHDAGVPARMVLTKQQPILGPDGRQTGKGFVLRFTINHEPGRGLVCTSSTVRSYRLQIAVLFAQRCPYLFDAGVSAASIEVEPARNESGTELVDEVNVLVWTAPVYDPAVPETQRIIIDTIRDAGEHGITKDDLLPKLRMAGIRALDKTILNAILLRLTSDYHIHQHRADSYRSGPRR